MNRYFIILIISLMTLKAQAQLNCNEPMITTPDTIVCKGDPVTIQALKRSNDFSIQLDGINDYVAILNSPSLNIDTAFTLEFWYKPDTTGFYYLVSKGPDTTVGWYALGRYPASVGNTYFGGIQSQGTPEPPPSIITGPPANPPFGEWVHLCFTGNNTIRRLYINGVLEVESSGLIAFAPNSYNLNIGRHQYTAFPYYTRGLMDEIRFWKRTLSQQEITDKMSRQLVASEETLLSLYYDCNQGSGIFMTDKSGNNNFGSLLNGAQYSTDVPFAFYSNDYNYLWSTGDTTQTITYNIPSPVSVSLIVTEGNTLCYDTVLIDVYAGPELNTTATTLCTGDSAILTSSGGLSYLWNTGDTTQTITVFTTGQYQVLVNDTNGCVSPSELLTVTAYDNPQPEIIVNGSITFCNGDSVLLSTGSYLSYAWSNGSTDSVIYVGNSGFYYVLVTDSGNCSGISSEVSISVVPGVNTSAIIGPVNVSAFGTYTYTVTQNTGNTYTWSATNGAIVNGQGTNSVNVTWSDISSGQLMVIESNSVCADTAYLNTAIFTSVSGQQSLPVRMYPNPCSKTLFLDGLNPDIPYELQILDIVSHQSLQRFNIRGTSTVDISFLPSGTYLIQLTDDKHGRSITRLVKSD